MPWSEALERAGLEAIEPLRNYALVFVGPTPNQDFGAGWWNPLSVAVVETSIGAAE